MDENKDSAGTHNPFPKQDEVDMSLLTIVQNALTEITAAHVLGDSVLVTTPCMYPSNGFVHVVIHGQGNTFSVTDNGGAVREIEATGIADIKPDKTLANLVRAQGLAVHDGKIVAPLVPLAALPIAIALVANASKEMAEWLFDNSKIKRPRDFKALVKEFLQNTFEKNAFADELIVGVSNKPHKFENLIILPNNRRLIIDPVMADASSVNARVVANMDVKMADIPGLEQRIIYDDDEDWKAADLNLLQVGAPVIPFSRSADAIRNLARVH